MAEMVKKVLTLTSLNRLAHDAIMQLKYCGFPKSEEGGGAE